MCSRDSKKNNVYFSNVLRFRKSLPNLKKITKRVNAVTDFSRDILSSLKTENLFNTIITFSSVIFVFWFNLPIYKTAHNHLFDADLDAGRVGFSMTYAMSLITLFSWMVRQSSLVENQVTDQFLKKL